MAGTVEMPNSPEYNRKYAQKRRAAETPEQAAERKAKNAERARKRRAEQSTGRGPGKPRIIEDEPTDARTVRIPSRYWDALREIGDDNASAGVRRLIEKHKRWKKTT